MKINQNYRTLKDSYLFSTVGKKANEFQAARHQYDPNGHWRCHPSPRSKSGGRDGKSRARDGR